MFKTLKFALPAALALTLLSPGVSSATPTSSNATWSWGGVYVANYVAYNNGDVGVSFENSSGTAFTAWNDQYGVNQCPNQPTLRVAFAYVAFDEIQEVLMEAALRHKELHVWFEATSGICYIKQVSVAF